MIDKSWSASAEMMAEIKALAELSVRTAEQQELIDLLEVVEHGPALGFDTTPVIQELAKKFKQWKYIQEQPRSVKAPPGATADNFPSLAREGGEAGVTDQ